MRNWKLHAPNPAIILLAILNFIVLCKVLSVTDFFTPSRYQPDFDNYYRTIDDMYLGVNPYTVGYMQNLGPPLVFFYFFPFRFISLHSAQTLNLMINISSGYVLCLVMSLYCFPKSVKFGFLVFSLILFTTFTSRYSLQIGQPILLFTLFITLIIFSARFRNVFLVSAIILKSFLLISLLTMYRDKENLFRTLSLLLMTITLGFIFIRPAWYSDYFFRRLPELKFLSPPAAATNLEYENQSFRATFARLGLAKDLQYIYPVSAIIACLLLLTKRRMELGIAVSFLLTPVFWQHYLIALFPLYVKLLFSVRNRKLLALLFISFFLWFPDLRLWTLPVTFINGLLASHFYLSVVLLAVVIFLNKEKFHRWAA